MVIGIIGESCTGKTTIVNELKKYIELKEYSGKDFLKFDKNPKNAEMQFKKMLNESKDEIIVYVITEKAHLNLLPMDAKRILVTASLEQIKERFKKRMNNRLPKPIEMMLERKHGMFNHIECNLRISSKDIKTNTREIMQALELKKQ